MRILIVSDTHGENDNFYKALEEVGTIDMVIHCGDSEGSEYILEKAAGCPLHIVSGNCDFFSDLPREEELEILGKNILITHGHYYSVNCGLDRLYEEAGARNIDIVVFGHTHRPTISSNREGIVILNPGSLSYPRQDGKECSYMIMEINDQGEVDYELCYLDT